MPPKSQPQSAPGSSSSTDAAAAAPAPAAAEATAAENPTHSEQTEEAGCPICQFLEAGPCGDQHKVWVSCRKEAKEQDVDFVQHCADNFRAFFGCMLSHQEYYQPFLEATGVDVDRSQQAIDASKDRGEQQQQQQHGEHSGGGKPHQPQQSAGTQQQQQQQQQQGLAKQAAGVGPGSSSSTKTSSN